MSADKNGVDKFRPIRNYIDPPFYDGRTLWRDFKIQFEMASTFNGWNVQEKCLQLGCSLRGLARNVLADYDINVNTEYDELVMHLENRFGHEQYQDVYVMLLEKRVHNQNESFPHLAYSMLRLVKFAYPDAPRSLIESMAKDYFINAITDVDIRRWVKFSEPRTLEEAIHKAVKVQVIQEFDRLRTTASIKKVDKNRSRCYRCNESGHLRALCPE